MEMNFDFQSDECAEVARAIRLRVEFLLRHPTPEHRASARTLQRFARKMQPVMVQCMAEASETIGRLN